MKIIILTSLFMVISAAQIFSMEVYSANTYLGGHDSLLFDGALNVTSESKCLLKVKKVKGKVEAKIFRSTVETICGVPDTITELKQGEAKDGDMLTTGDAITTGSDGEAYLELPDGSEIKMAPNSKIIIFAGVHCQIEHGGIKVEFGKLWVKMKKILGSKKYELISPCIALGLRGTEFTVETGTDADIVKVYEGTVEVKPSEEILSRIASSDGGDLEKVTKDFQEGKITMEEYQKKIMEFSDKMNKAGDKIKNPQMVTVGNKITVDKDGNMSSPESINDDDKWFEEIK